MRSNKSLSTLSDEELLRSLADVVDEWRRNRAGLATYVREAKRRPDLAPLVEHLGLDGEEEE